jgi:hypothetical protein
MHQFDPVMRIVGKSFTGVHASRTSNRKTAQCSRVSIPQSILPNAILEHSGFLDCGAIRKQLLKGMCRLSFVI